MGEAEKSVKFVCGKAPGVFCDCGDEVAREEFDVVVVSWGDLVTLDWLKLDSELMPITFRPEKLPLVVRGTGGAAVTPTLSMATKSSNACRSDRRTGDRT